MGRMGAWEMAGAGSFEPRSHRRGSRGRRASASNYPMAKEFVETLERTLSANVDFAPSDRVRAKLRR